jgi:hypothetical protein
LSHPSAFWQLTAVAAQQDWFGMASIYVYRSDGVVAFSNRPMLLPYVFGDAIRPDPEGFAREATCDAFVGSISPVMGVKPLGPGEAITGSATLSVTASRLIELARGAGRWGIVHDLIPPRNGSSGGTTGIEQRLTDLFRHYDFSYRRQFLLRGRRIQEERIPAATINGGIGGIAWGAWVPENWSQSSRNPADEMDVALRRGLANKAGGPLCEPAAGWVEAYLGEIIEHAALLGLDQVQSLTWMYCASRGRTWPTARHNFQQTMLYATPEFISAVIALPLQRMKSSAFHRQLTEGLLPEWTGVGYVGGVGERTPHIWDGDGLQLLNELAEGTTAELTWMLDRNKVRTVLDRLSREELDDKPTSGANRLLTTFAVLAEAERDFGRLNAELTAVSQP